jgi:hypothetical protein
LVDFDGRRAFLADISSRDGLYATEVSGSFDFEQTREMALELGRQAIVTRCFD